VNLFKRVPARLRDRGPVLVTLATALASITALAYGPGALTGRAAAQTRVIPPPPAATTATQPAPHVAATTGSEPRLQIIAHSGGDDWGPAGTLRTIDHAIGANAAGIEFDVRFTSDGVPVVMHDATLDDTTDCRGPVARMTLARISKCRVGHSDRVATLDQVLTAISRSTATAYVDVKVADSAAQAQKIMAAINAHRLNDPARLTVIGPSPAILEQMRRAGARRLGLVFGDPSGWHSPYPVLVVYDTAVTPALVADAQRRGHFVVVVQGHPTRTVDVAALHLDGFMANGLAAALQLLARVPAPVHTDRVIDRGVPTRPRTAGPGGS